MRAVNNGNAFHIYNDAVSLYNNLPPQVYQIEFDPMSGYSLSKHEDITISEKIYGVHPAKVEKVMNSFKVFGRSLGVILSGDKGIGKSLFSKMLCVKAIKDGYPVIICNGFTPGIAQFIDSINQECIVLFDEFDKTFSGDDNEGTQARMLSLFDGVSMNKKLFCVTCNKLNNLNNFLVNRPGRFHYHFRFEYPTKDEIDIYLKDHLPQEKWTEIPKIITFSKKVQLNYDCLRAIAFELLITDTFEAAISDLNIIKEEYSPHVTCNLVFADGTRMRNICRVDTFSDEEEEIWFGGNEIDESYLKVQFIPSDTKWSEEQGCMFIPANTMKIIEDIDEEDEDIKSNRNFVDAHLAKDVIGMTIRTHFSQQRNIHYYNC